MDLSTLKQLESIEYVLETPSGRQLDVVFLLAGPTHPNRKALEGRAHRQIAKAVNNRSGEIIPEDPTAFYERETDAIVNAVLGWENLSVDGKELPFNAQNSREFFSNPQFRWIRDAVQRAIQNANLFIGNSSTN